MEPERKTLFEEKGGILDDTEDEPAPILAYRIFVVLCPIAFIAAIACSVIGLLRW